MSKSEVTEKIEIELKNKFVDVNSSQSQQQSTFIARALGNFFDTNTLEEFYEFLKEE